MWSLTLEEFCRALFEVVTVPKGDEVYLLAGMISFFKQATSNDTIEWRDFTSFVVEKIVDVEHVSMNEVQNKYISKITSNFTQIASSPELMHMTPTVYGGSEKCLRRFDFHPEINEKGLSSMNTQI